MNIVMMNDNLENLQYFPIRDYKYATYFEEVQYNGKTLTVDERKEFVAVIDETISDYSDGLPLIKDILESIKELPGEYLEIERTVASVMLFVLITMIDSMVASKYFLLADKDYDRRYMRGKLMVILNEGFKQLYGFDKKTKKTHKESEWDRLSPLMKYFSDDINQQYRELTFLLERHSKSSSWWREERNCETHLDAEKLYASRQEEIIESKVMMDSTKLFNTLLAVDRFLTNMHACLMNYLREKIRRGEIIV